jgi:mannose-6-phosphate isomerase-like protein (cupin superfamily)
MSFPKIENGTSKAELVAAVQAHLEAQGMTIAEIDAARPWGAFLRIINAQADQFIAAYYGDIQVPFEAQHGERSPKILLVAPHQRLSWQYHNRRAEVWRAIDSDVGVFFSDTDAQPDDKIILRAGEEIELARGTRHRLVGLDTWGAVAEIWIHTDPQRLSDENDIVRLQDDYARH